MRLLDRYLLRELAIPFSYCLGGFFVFWLTFDLFNQLPGFQRRGMDFFDGFEYYLVKTPELLVFVVPVALLLSILYALTNHARYHELTAIRAAGVSLLRLSVPYLLVGFILSIGLFALNEIYVPDSVRSAEQILSRHSAAMQEPGAKDWERKVYFQRQGRKWGIEAYNLATGEMIHPHLTWESADGTFHDFTAEAAAHQDGAWVFTNAVELVFPPTAGSDPAQRKAAVLVLPGLTETPQQISGQIKIGKMTTLKTASETQLSILEILDYKRWNPGKTAQSTMLDTKLHGRIADPWKCLVIVFIALPFGATSTRRNVFAGVASSILIGFAYFVLLQLGLALGSGGYLPPLVAAWAPNVLFSSIGILMSWKAQ